MSIAVSEAGPAGASTLVLDAHPRSADARSRFRPDIEGLRAVAILSVVAFHCGLPFVTGGFVGVDMFFVLSGYLITGLLTREVEQTSRIDLVQFYARRVRRLLPASSLTLLLTLGIAAVMLAPNELQFTARAGRAAALYLSNVFFAINAADYFGPRVDSNAILHTWSLAVEEQFYLLWPLLLMVGLQWWRSERRVVLLLTAVTCASFATCVYFTAHGGTFAFYQLPARAWEFGIGGLATFVPAAVVARGPRVWKAAGIVGCGLVAGSVILIRDGSGFPGWIAMLPVLGTSLILISGSSSPETSLGGVLRVAPLQRIGKLSYSWYLSHWPVLVFVGILLPSVGVFGKVVAGAAALGIAAIAHHLVENPIRFHPGLVRRPVLSIAIGLALTLTCAVAGLEAQRYARQLGRSPEMTRLTAATSDIARMSRTDCVTLGQSFDVKTCTFGQTSSPVRVVLFGDSHAIQWVNPLQDVASDNGWQLVTVLKSGCPATDVRIDDDQDDEPCSRWRTQAVETILRLRPALVVLGSATNRPGRVDGRYLEKIRQGTRRTVQAFADHQVPVAIIRDVPRFGFDVPTCLARAVRHRWYPAGSCDAPETSALAAGVFSSERDAVTGLEGVTLVDVTDALCRDAVCTTVSNGMPMYRDDNHLTSAFATSLRPRLEPRLVAALSRQSR